MSHAPVEASQYTGSDLQHAKGTMELNRQVDEGTPWSGNERNQVFLNLGPQKNAQNLPRFADVSAVAGFDLPDDSRAIASLDWDHDGDLDIITTNRTAPRFRIFENTLPLRPASSLFIQLSGTGSKTNRDAIGSRLTLVLDQNGEAIQIQRSLRAGEGFLSQSSKWIHFGIPKNTTISNLTVHWHGHDSQTFQNIQAGKSYHLTQDRSKPVEFSHPTSAPKLIKAPPHSPPHSPSPLTLLERPLPLPNLPYTDLDGQALLLSHTLTKPTILTLWATWCPDCLEELQHLSEHAEELRASGFDVLALCVDSDDEPGQLAKARHLLKESNFPFATGIATTKTLNLIHLAHNNVFLRPSKLPVPATLIIGPGHKLHAIARGPITLPDLKPTLTAMTAMTREHWKTFALPAGPGIWQHGADAIPYSGIAKELLDRGWLDDAADYLLNHRADLLADGPIYPKLLMAVGTQLLAKKQSERGIALLQSAVQAAPDLAAAHNNLAVAYLQTGRADDAAPHLESALAIDPNFSDARLNLARYHLSIQDLSSAQALIAPILKKGYHPSAIRLQAQIHLAQQDIPSLLGTFQLITKNEPQDPSAWANLGKLQSQLGKPTQALAAFQKAAQLQPENLQLQRIIQQLREAASD